MASSDATFKHVFTAKNPGSVDDYYHVDRKALGEGSYGRVVKARNKASGAIRAIKVIDISKIKNKERFQAEIDIQMNLDHPNIVKLYETFQDAKRIYLVLEICDGGELFDRIVEETEKHEGTAFSEQDVGKYMCQILGAMQYLHSNSYAHRDIKPENFLLQNKTKEAEIKVIDFGLAKRYSADEPMMTKAGTPYYVAPQVLLGRGYNEKCDIWSCGVICYILICGYPPFYGDNDNEILTRVKKGAFDYPPADWSDNTAEVKDFINNMLTMDPEARPSAKDLLDHKWISMATSGANAEVKVPNTLPNNMRKFRRSSKFRKIILTMIAQNLPDSEVTEIRRTFAALDSNKDGTLTLGEISEGLKKHGLDVTKDLEDDLKGLDTDGSGVIDYSEFIAATLERQQYMKEDMAWSAFRMFDTDGDGQITKAELHAVLQDPDFKESAAILLEADTDASGTISFDEFKRMLDGGK